MAKSCNCYCGVATKANRSKWTAFGVLLTLGAVFLVALCARSTRCISGDTLECQQQQRHGPVSTYCQGVMTQYDDCVLDDMSAIASLEIFWLLCWIGASIPLYMMCCCTEPPHMVSVEGIQMGMPPDWSDPNAQALHDSPDEEALLGDPYASLTRK